MTTTLTLSAKVGPKVVTEELQGSSLSFFFLVCICVHIERAVVIEEFAHNFYFLLFSLLVIQSLLNYFCTWEYGGSLTFQGLSNWLIA